MHRQGDAHAEKYYKKHDGSYSPSPVGCKSHVEYITETAPRYERRFKQPVVSLSYARRPYSNHAQGEGHTGISLQALWISSNAPGFTDPLKRDEEDAKPKMAPKSTQEYGTPQSNWIQKATCAQEEKGQESRARRRPDISESHLYVRRESKEGRTAESHTPILNIKIADEHPQRQAEDSERTRDAGFPTSSELEIKRHI